MASVSDRSLMPCGGLAFLDNILRGAKLAELPMERLTKFKIAVYLKTARPQVITMLPSFLLRATEEIE